MHAFLTRVRTWWKNQSALRYCKRLARLGTVQLEEELLSLAEPGCRIQFARALRRVSRCDRRLLLLYEARALSLQAIARHLQVSEAEALRQLSRAVAHFQQEVRAMEAASQTDVTDRMCA